MEMSTWLFNYTKVCNYEKSRVSLIVGDGLDADRVSHVQMKLRISLALLRMSHRGLIRLQIDKRMFKKRTGWTS